MKSSLLVAVILILALAVVLSSCTVENNSPGGGVDLTNQFLVANLPRSTNTFEGTTFVPDNHRTFFVTFSIGTGTATEGEYRLGLKAVSKPAPTVSELVDASAAITRTLSSNQINIYLPFHLEGTYFDTGVTQDYTNARATLLSPATKYSLYLTSADGSGTVKKIQDFTTDAVPATVPGTLFYGLPSAKYTYTVRTNDPFMLINEFKNYSSTAIYYAKSQDFELVICGVYRCEISPLFPLYKILTPNPKKTFIFEGRLKDQWNNMSFHSGETELYVYFTFQTAP